MLEFEHLFKSSKITVPVSKNDSSSEDITNYNLRGDAFKAIFEQSVGSGTTAKNGKISPPCIVQQQDKEHRHLSGGSALILEGSKPTEKSIAEFAALQGIDPSVMALIMGENWMASSDHGNDLVRAPLDSQLSKFSMLFPAQGLTTGLGDSSTLSAVNTNDKEELASKTETESAFKDDLIISDDSNPTINVIAESTLDALGKRAIGEAASATILDSEGGIKAKNNLIPNLLDVAKTSLGKAGADESDSKSLLDLPGKNPLGGESLNKAAILIGTQNRAIESSSKLAHKNIIKFQNLIPTAGVQKMDMINLGKDAEEILSLLSSSGAGNTQVNVGSSIRADTHTHLIANQMSDLRVDLAAKSFAETQENLDQQQLVRRQDQYLEISRRLTEALGERLTAQISKGAWRVEMDLHPRSLGRIEINLEMKNGNLEAYFNPSQNVTRELLQDSFEKLKDILAQHGIDSAYVGLGSGKKQHSDGNPTDDTLVAKRDSEAEPDTLSISSSGKKAHLSADGLDIQV